MVKNIEKPKKGTVYNIILVLTIFYAFQYSKKNSEYKCCSSHKTKMQFYSEKFPSILFPQLQRVWKSYFLKHLHSNTLQFRDWLKK